jgi:zinc transport system substrate-binding protein
MKGYKALFIGVVTLLVLFSVILTGCTRESSSAGNGDKMTVYTSLFPIYDFAKQIGGDYVEVKSIVPPGAEAHDFEPNVKDMVALSNARVFIYNGAGYENWIDKAIENLDGKKTLIVDASKGVQLLNAEGHADEHANEEDHDHGTYDPHIWLDPVRAKQQALNIQKAFVSADPAHEQEYKKNYETLAKELDSLDQKYRDAVAKANKKQFVTAHNAFAYLAAQYGLEQIAISGLSPSVEPGQKELQALIEVVKKNNIRYIAFEELVESKVAKTVQKETGAEAVMLNPVENVTKEELKANKSYIDLMNENLEVLKKVLEVHE